MKIHWYYYTHLKEEPQEYDVQLDRLLIQNLFRQIKIHLKVIVERICKQIEKQDAKVVDLFLLEFV